MVQGLAPPLNLLAGFLAMVCIGSLAGGLLVYGTDNQDWQPASFLLLVSARRLLSS